MAEFWRGWRAMVPLYVGVIPFGLAYAVSARSAGLGLLDTQLMSLAVFAGSAQFSAAGLFAVQAGWLALVLTTFVINVRHLLYSLTLSQRLLAAQFLTDEAFGVVIASGRTTLGFLLGAELSLYAVWNLSTLIGGLASSAVTDPQALGVDFIFPLTFLALLIPLLKRPLEIAVALFCGLATVLLVRVFNPGLIILVIGLGGSLLGAWLSRGRPTSHLGRRRERHPHHPADGAGDLPAAAGGLRPGGGPGVALLAPLSSLRADFGVRCPDRPGAARCERRNRDSAAGGGRRLGGDLALRKSVVRHSGGDGRVLAAAAAIARAATSHPVDPGRHEKRPPPLWRPLVYVSGPSYSGTLLGLYQRAVLADHPDGGQDLLIEVERLALTLQAAAAG